MRNIITSLFFGIGALIVVGAYMMGAFPGAKNGMPTTSPLLMPLTSQVVPTPTPLPSPSPLPGRVVHSVSFIAQAPFGDWADPRQQGACEESTMLMAVRWARGEVIDRATVLQDIFALSDFGKRRFGTIRDTSAQDTALFATEFFNHPNVSVKSDPTIDDIRRALASGAVVAVPTNGQVIGNPYYTPPGSAYHMVLIIGYDDARGVFITNDPGTRHGASFEYPYTTLYNGIRDYPTGDHEPVLRIIKTMIVVRPAMR